MDQIEISIAQDGTVTFLYNEDTAILVTPETTIQRARHVEPVSIPLRILFHGLRKGFGEYGWVATFTRRWRCLWRINMTPVGHGIMTTLYRDRAAAIAAEIEYLNEHFI